MAILLRQERINLQGTATWNALDFNNSRSSFDNLRGAAGNCSDLLSSPTAEDRISWNPVGSLLLLDDPAGF